MSLRQMADRSGISNAYLSQIERGLHQPSVRVLRAIASALGLSPEILLGHTATGEHRQEPASAEDALSAPGQTENAIRADAALTTGQKETLLQVYRSFRDS